MNNADGASVATVERRKYTSSCYAATVHSERRSDEHSTASDFASLDPWPVTPTSYVITKAPLECHAKQLHASCLVAKLQYSTSTALECYNQGIDSIIITKSGYTNITELQKVSIGIAERQDANARKLIPYDPVVLTV